MDALPLLRHVTADLEERIYGPHDEYQLLRASGLLRLMLTDHDPALLPKVSRAAGVPLEFHTRTRPGPPMLRGAVAGPGCWSVGHYGITPHAPWVPHVVTLEQFRAMAVAYTGDGRLISVKRAIRTAAHGFGGVHFELITDPEDQALADYLASFPPSEPVTHQLTKMIVDIGRVTIGAARSLLHEIDRRSAPAVRPVDGVEPDLAGLEGAQV